MKRNALTKNQINELLKNVNVQSCSSVSITYTKAFKLQAIARYAQGSTMKEIFREAGLDIDLIGKEQPKECLHRWNRLFRSKGEIALTEQRGKNARSKPSKKGITDADKIQKLEAEVAYLKAENDFLTKLRAKRAESNSGHDRNT
jgi:transposase-like protein